MRLNNQGMDVCNLKEQANQYSDNYQSSNSCVSRYMFLSHTLLQLNEIKQKLQQHEKNNSLFGKDNCLQIDDTKNILHQDSSLYIGQKFINYINQVYKKKQNEDLQISDILWMIYSTFKSEIWIVIILSLGENILKLVFTYLLQQIFNELLNENKSRAYILTIFAFFVNIVSQNLKYNVYYMTPIFTAKLRSGLVTIIYAKVSSLSKFTLKNSQIAKIFNVISNDFNSVQQRIPIIAIPVIFPFCLIGSAIILYYKMGWIAVIGLLFPLILFPFQNYISDKNAELLKKVNQRKDERIKITKQVIEGIQFIKMYGWQYAFKNMVEKIRQKEILAYTWLIIGRAFQLALANFIALFTGYIIFVLSHYFSNTLTLTNMFFVIYILNVLRPIITYLGVGLGLYYELITIFQRCLSILNIKNIKMIPIDGQNKQIYSTNRLKYSFLDNNPRMWTRSNQLNANTDANNQKQNFNVDIRQGQIVFRDFNGYWSKETTSKPALQNINVHFKRGKFYGICGKVGSGKSSILSVILEQIPYYSGFYKRLGKISYVEQQPILFSTTIRQNILFGKKFDSHKYKSAIMNSCLETDLQQLQHGDETVVGERGLTLSGGQKARLALARALYADGDIFLLDDPLSAVDSKVGKEIYEKVIKRLRQSKTVILVTHQIHYLQECDQVLILEDGKVIHHNSPQFLKNQLKAELLKNKTTNEDDQIQFDIEEITQVNANISNIINNTSQKISPLNSSKNNNSTFFSSATKEKNVQVSLPSYVQYLFYDKINNFIFPLTIVFFICTQFLYALYMRLLSEYNFQKSNQSFEKNIKIYWIVIGLMLIFYLVLSIIQYFLTGIIVILNHKTLHQNMFFSLVRSPLSYFDINSTGKLINLFSNDLGALDIGLITILIDLLEGVIFLIFALGNVYQLDLYFIISTILGLIGIAWYLNYCKDTIIKTKQLDLKTRTSLLNIIVQTIEGVTHIKIFENRPIFIKQLSRTINNLTRANICFWNCNRAFIAYISFFLTIILLVGYLQGIYLANKINAHLYGISAVYLMSMNQKVQWFVRQIITFQSVLISSERIKSFISRKSEKKLITQYDSKLGFEIQDNEMVKQYKTNQYIKNIMYWPPKATVEFKNLSMKYQQNLPTVLSNLSIKIKSGERVGIVGRTGAGKSSIIQTIFRLREPETGSQYYFGGYNALEMGLHTLRNHISVIPQTPFLFKGTIRQNIDPLNQRQDQEIWRVLQLSCLSETVKKMQNKLQTYMSNSAQVFSVGQKQLLCMARALLRKENRLLVIDQATSNVDMKTDSFIQNTIKNHLNDMTVITIAHRLNTIANYDKLIVMSNGKIVQTGHPYQLLQKDGQFLKMVDKTGKRAHIIKQIAKQAYFQKNTKRL